jgi:hypothetical protein
MTDVPTSPSSDPPKKLYAIRPGTLSAAVRIALLRDQEGVCITCGAWLLPQRYYCFEQPVPPEDPDRCVPYFAFCKLCCTSIPVDKLVLPPGES